MSHSLGELSEITTGHCTCLIARRSEDGSIGNDKDGAIYKSTDNAETWSRVAMPEGSNAPNGLAIDPAIRDVFIWRRGLVRQDCTATGVACTCRRTVARHGDRCSEKDRHIYDVTIDPRDAKILYASGFESSAWRSSDRGEHWGRIPGFNFKWGHRVMTDPADAQKIYITTFGGGVWHGSVNGEDRPVDITTPELRPGLSPNDVEPRNIEVSV